MAAIQFPANPNVGDLFTASNGIRYTYDGEKWKTLGTSTVGSEGQFLETPTVLTVDKLIPANTNTGVVGPIAIGTGVVLTVPSSSTFRTLTGRSGAGSGGNTEIEPKMPISGGTFTGPVNFANDAIIKGNAVDGSGKLTLNCENNSHGIHIKGPPHSAGANYTLTLPNDTGTNGQVLTTNGSGVSSWSTIDLSSKLSLTGGTLTGDLTIPDKIIHSGDTDTSIRFPSANTFAIETAGTQRVTVDSSGNVGVGVTNPQTGLHISDGSSLAGPQNTGAGRLTIQNSSSADIQLMSANTGYNHIFFGDQDDANAGVIYYQHNSGVNAMVFTTNAAERLRIDSSGRLLVGTSSSPTVGSGAIAKSVIQGNTSNSAGAGYLSLQRGQAAASISSGETLGLINFADSAGNDYAIIKGRTGAAGGSNDYPGELVFATAADGASVTTDRMIIDSSGTATFAADASINSLTIGRGAGNVNGNTALGYLALEFNNAGVAGNTAVGIQALYANTTGVDNTAVGMGTLQLNTTGSNNVAIGRQSLFFNTTGSNNTATGEDALRNNTTANNNTAHGFKALYSNTTGTANTSIGMQSLYTNSTGSYNLASGMYALYYNTTGTKNVASGYQALYSNTTGNNSVAIGYQALRTNTTAGNNIAVGYQTLYSNTTGGNNTAVGLQTLYSNSTGSDNSAFGRHALFANTTGSYNTSLGKETLRTNTTGVRNTATGYYSLALNTTGSYNTVSGYQALYSNTTANYNVAAGYHALKNNTTGSFNVAVGNEALISNTTASENTAVGNKALKSNTTGFNNSAHGAGALHTNSTGSYNTANGYHALFYNTTGTANTAIGNETLVANTTGASNTAVGHKALFTNTTGDSNTAIGLNTLRLNTTGNYNAANGYDALKNNTTGSQNTALGFQSLTYNTTANNNTAYGYQALLNNTTGVSNTAVGNIAGRNNTTGSYNNSFGNGANADLTTGSNNTSIGVQNSSGYAPVFNVTTQNSRFVCGHTSITNAYVKVAWTVTSDERDKMNFAPVPYGLDFVNQLKPTAYQFKVDRDTETPSGDVRYGFKAQDILALEGDNPVIIDTEDADHLKYKGEHLVPVLVNAVQELSTMVKELQAEIKTLKG